MGMNMSMSMGSGGARPQTHFAAIDNQHCAYETKKLNISVIG